MPGGLPTKVSPTVASVYTPSPPGSAPETASDTSPRLPLFHSQKPPPEVPFRSPKQGLPAAVPPRQFPPLARAPPAAGAAPPRPRPKHRRSVSLGADRNSPPAMPSGSPYAPFPAQKMPMTRLSPPQESYDKPVRRPMPPPMPPAGQRLARRRNSRSIPDSFARMAAMQMSPMQQSSAPMASRPRTPESYTDETSMATPRLGVIKSLVMDAPEFKSEWEGFPEQTRELLDLKDMEEAAFHELELEDIERRAMGKAEQLRTEILQDEQRLAEIDRALAALMGDTFDPVAAQAEGLRLR